MQLTAEQQVQLDEVMASEDVTRRPIAPGIEALMHTPFPVLDHGFIRVVDYMGGDDAIVQAARVSYGRGTERVSSDRTLLRYLMRQRHSSPFEMARVKIHVSAPIFVMRQWIRHRTSSTNEISGRYSILPDDTYEPALDVVSEQSPTNRQGRGAALPRDEAERVRRTIAEQSEAAFVAYEELLNVREDGEPRDVERSGVARELARVVLPLATYTQWYWTTDAHNLLNFCSLRSDEHAQLEIRAYSDIILHQIIAAWMPLTYEAFIDYRMGARTFSAGELAVLRSALDARARDAIAARRGESGLGRREWREFSEAMGLDGRREGA